MPQHLPTQSESPHTDAPVRVTPVPEVKRAGIVARMLHGTGASAVGYGLGIGSNLLLLPLYLHFWTVSVYGEWMALYSVVNYLSNLDFGVTSAAANAATIAYARKDWPEFKRIQGTAWAISLVFAGLGAALVIGLSLFYFHVNRWLGLTVINERDARLVFYGLSIALLANIPGRQLIAVFISIGKFPTYQWLYNAFALSSVIITAAGLIAGAQPVALALLGAGTTLLMILFAAWFLGRESSSLIPRLRDANWNTAQMLASPTGHFGISMIATALTLQGPVIVLSRALGGPAVALFTTTRTVANVVRGTLALLRGPLGPELSAASAQPDKNTLRSLFRIAVGLDATIAICLTAVLWQGGVWLIRFWSHGHITPDPQLLHLLLIAFIVEGFLQILAVAGWSTNQFQAWSIGQLVSAFVSLTLAVTLLGRFGPSAIPLGFIVPLVVIMTPLSVRNARKEARLGLRFVVVRMLLPFAFLVAFSVAVPAYIDTLKMSPGWLFGSISASIVCAAAALAGTTVFLTQADREMVCDRVFTPRVRSIFRTQPL
ncbi:MAG: hypothetical protein P4L50_07765 [Anaerolineaceae bacterium]|nr:hypothetical protein [Anaerolineaceae bacterium]